MQQQAITIKSLVKQAGFKTAAQQVYQKLGSRKRTNRSKQGSTKRSAKTANNVQLKLL